jgi:hypothetical protein
MVETCQALLEDEQKRSALSEAAAAYFDKYLRLEQLGGYYVSQCLDWSGSQQPAPIPPS